MCHQQPTKFNDLNINHPTETIKNPGCFSNINYTPETYWPKNTTKSKLIKLNDEIAGLQFKYITDDKLFYEFDKLYEEVKQIIKEV